VNQPEFYGFATIDIPVFGNAVADRLKNNARAINYHPETLFLDEYGMLNFVEHGLERRITGAQRTINNLLVLHLALMDHQPRRLCHEATLDGKR
jgi:hypothetical protein